MKFNITYSSIFVIGYQRVFLGVIGFLVGVWTIVSNGHELFYETTTIAGSRSSKFVSGIGTFASFSPPRGLAVDNVLNVVYVATNSSIQLVNLVDYSVSTFCGKAGATGMTNSIGTYSRFGGQITDVGVLNNRLHVVDSSNNRIRLVIVSVDDYWGTLTGDVKGFVGKGGGYVGTAPVSDAIALAIYLSFC